MIPGITHRPTSAAEGLAMALARAAGSASTAPASAAPVTGPQMGIAPARSDCAPAKPKNRVQIVADAVAKDARCKGKAAAALVLLADDSLAAVPGRGLVKILAAMPEGEGSAMLAATNRTNASQISASRNALRPSKASAAMWDRAIARNAGKPLSDAFNGGAKAWGTAISKMEGNA